MPGLNPKLLGDWIQIVASLGVLAGFLLLAIDLAQVGRSTSTGRSTPAVNAAARVSAAEEPGEITGARQAELREFVETNCPACHGEQLAGSIGPALSEDGLRHLSVEAVSFMILNGYEAKGMPAWNAQLSKRDTAWIAKFLKRGGG